MPIISSCMSIYYVKRYSLLIITITSDNLLRRLLLVYRYLFYIMYIYQTYIYWYDVILENKQHLYVLSIESRLFPVYIYYRCVNELTCHRWLMHFEAFIRCKGDPYKYMPSVIANVHCLRLTDHNHSLLIFKSNMIILSIKISIYRGKHEMQLKQVCGSTLFSLFAHLWIIQWYHLNQTRRTKS